LNSGRITLIPEFIEPSRQAKYDARVEEWVESGEKVVLYGHHRDVFAIWMKQLSQYHPVMYTGSETLAQKQQAMISFAGAPPGSNSDLYVGGPSQVFIIANRAGAGLDGLQFVARVAIIGEFDWSAGILEQNIGRLDREGQKGTVLPYLMMSDTISDHKLAEVNGVKRQQITGVRDLKAAFVEKLQTDPGHIRSMAKLYLESRGLSV
jgi:hypothetical protein